MEPNLVSSNILFPNHPMQEEWQMFENRSAHDEILNKSVILSSKQYWLR
jgi:hypothetical protein